MPSIIGEEKKVSGLTFMPGEDGTDLEASVSPQITFDPSVSNAQIDESYIDSALTWAVNLAMDFRCPVCGNIWEIGTPDEKSDGLRSHLQSQHFARVVVGYAQKDLDAVFKITRDKSEADDNLFEHVGIDVDPEAGDRYNCFDVDPELQRKLTADGSKFHWSTLKNVPRYKQRGMVVVGGIAEDGTFKGPDNTFGSQSMILMLIPSRLVEKRALIKARNVDNSVDSSKERQMGRIGDIQRKAHDMLAKRGASADQIRNVVQAVGVGLERGILRVKDQKGSRQYQV